MNEVQLIRAQLSTERRHAAEVASALERAGTQAAQSGGALAEFRQACVDYLVWVLARFEERDQLFADLLHSRLAPEDAARRALDETLARSGKSREALAKLEAALASSPASADRTWRDFGEFFNAAWSPRRDAIDQLLERNARVGDWRVISGIDADSILEERTRHARVAAK
jgi:hypothetical protein